MAISDETQLLASPLAVLPRRAEKRLPLGAFLTIVETELPVGLVVGLPLGNIDDAESPSLQGAREMGELFAERSKLPVDWVDESFSTAEVLDRLTARGVAPRSRRESVDALAAAVVLERWLAARREGSA